MPKKIDLTGQRFNKLLVLEEAPRPDKKHPIKWICQCECGNITNVRPADLRSGHTKTCGKCSTNKIDILGQQFGKLTVIEALPSNRRGDAMWKCKCECGKIIKTTGKALRSGETKSCGCVRIEKLITQNQSRALNLAGQQFGELIAIEPTERREGGKVIWKCQCSCGKEVFVSSSNLTKGNTKSCGCHNLSFGENKITKILQQHSINFETQKKFENLKFSNGYFARFDFYLPDYNTIIEYDGRQHFIQGNGVFDNKEKFAQTQAHDQIKNKYCKNNNIILIRIPYTHYDNITIEDLLPSSSKFII